MSKRIRIIVYLFVLLLFFGLGFIVGSQLTSYTDECEKAGIEKVSISDNAHKNMEILQDYVKYAVQSYCAETGKIDNYTFNIFDDMLHNSTKITANEFFQFDLNKSITRQLAGNKFIFEVKGESNDLYVVIDTYRMKIYVYESDNDSVRVFGGNYDVTVKEEDLEKIVECDWEDMWEEEYYSIVKEGWAYLSTPSLDDMMINTELYGMVIYSLRRYCEENNIEEQFHFDFSEDLVSSVAARIFTVKVESDSRTLYMDLDLDRNKVHVYEVFFGYQQESKEDMVYDYLFELVPELHNYADYILEQSDGKAHLTIQVFETPREIEDDIGRNGNYYAVYVGEQRENSRVNWDWFYVEIDLGEVLWYNLPEDVYYTLDEWRQSEYYREL